MSPLQIISLVARGTIPDCPPGHLDACIRLGLLEREDGRLVLTDDGWRILEQTP